MPELSAALAAFAGDGEDPPAAARAVALQGCIDAIGVMLAGQGEPVVQALRETCCSAAPAGRSSVLLSAQRVRAQDAALVNATAAHALALDDVTHGCHPSAVLMPALWAVAQDIGAGGAALLSAYVVGHEVLAELALREPDPLHAGCWHPTGVLMPVAAAAAVARLLRLPAARCGHAMGIAASLGGGLIANFGTPTKALQAGHAASAGVLAATLAARGVTASATVLEASKGLLAAVSPQGRVDLLRPAAPGRVDLLRPAAPGQGWRILEQGLCIKNHAVCYSTHRVVDAAIALAQQHGSVLDQIERIEVFIGAEQAALARYHQPREALQARYSVEFAAVCGLVAQAAGFAQLDAAFINSALVQQLMARTTLELRAGQSQDDPVFCPSDRVRLHLQGGRLLDSGEWPHALGHFKRPLSEAQLRAKFMACASRGGCTDAATLHRQLLALPMLQSLDELLAVPEAVGP